MSSPSPATTMVASTSPQQQQQQQQQARPQQPTNTQQTRPAATQPGVAQQQQQQKQQQQQQQLQLALPKLPLTCKEELFGRIPSGGKSSSSSSSRSSSSNNPNKSSSSSSNNTEEAMVAMERLVGAASSGAQCATYVADIFERWACRDRIFSSISCKAIIEGYGRSNEHTIRHVLKLASRIVGIRDMFQRARIQLIVSKMIAYMERLYTRRYVGSEIKLAASAEWLVQMAARNPYMCDSLLSLRRQSSARSFLRQLEIEL
mmetsp:Transcript_2888/g.4490  ORF Transcript_2888/g.4490 Transcript_2888/m.4490 type:complete len:260 (-) Transcript_2888:137-916(-)